MKEPAKRSGSVRRGRRDKSAGRESDTPKAPLVSGGRYAPLSPVEVQFMHKAVLEILETVGMSEVPPSVVGLIISKGGELSDDGRLLFPKTLVDAALADLPKEFTLYGQTPGHEMHLGGTRVHVGSGGASPAILDIETGKYRDSTLKDLYDAARMVDALENVHFFSRSLVARDMDNPRALDINTAFASLTGTAKHVFTSASQPAHVQAIADMCAIIAGSAEAFRERPFLSLNINHVVPPLRFDAESCEVLIKAVRLGVPVSVNTFGQLGASSPVTIAGSVTQTIAETLAGAVLAWAVDPGAKVIFGPRPMVTDLRNGAMSGGGGEQALLTATAIQMARHYGLPNSTIAGATDAKIADAQAGFEKALNVSLAVQAGCNIITQACGVQASLMGASFEAYVIDNDMLGAILRSASAMEVSPQTISAAMISEVVRGDGHYLGHADTFARMETDFLYPRIADRRSPAEWEADGSPDIREVARNRAKEILSIHFPHHVGEEAQQLLRKANEIKLPARATCVQMNA
jgi:trimethylamine--corrinoid protein Co-methyltransferase